MDLPYFRCIIQNNEISLKLIILQNCLTINIIKLKSHYWINFNYVNLVVLISARPILVETYRCNLPETHMFRYSQVQVPFTEQSLP